MPPLPNHVTGHWKPSLPPINFSPVFNRFPIDINWCGNQGPNRRSLLIQAHENAYKIAKLALRTVEWIRQQDESSRAFYWHWGVSNDPYLRSYWGNDPIARIAGLGHWFGPYSKPSLEQIRTLFLLMVDMYENGVRKGNKRVMPSYRCLGLCTGNSSTGAQHPNKYEVIICPAFWNDLSGNPDQMIFWNRSRAQVVLHEWMHSGSDIGQPRDICDLACNSNGWKCWLFWGTCYQGVASATWDYATDNGGDPRRLVLNQEYSKARNNIDNYTSWAIARWVNPRWSAWTLSDGPANIGPIPVDY